MSCERPGCGCVGILEDPGSRYCSQDCRNATTPSVDECRCGHGACAEARDSSKGIEKGWSWNGALLGGLVLGGSLLLGG